MDTFAQRLRDAMLRAGLEASPQALAKLCGISRQTATNWLAMAEAEMKGKLLLKLSNCLKVRMRWLAEGKGPMGKSDQMDRLTEIAAGLPPDRLKKWMADGERMMREA